MRGSQSAENEMEVHQTEASQAWEYLRQPSTQRPYLKERETEEWE